MSFMEHLAELRLRLRNAAVVFLLAVIGSFFVVETVLRLPDATGARGVDGRAPGQEPVFRFASPTEPFWVYTKLAMYGALLVASPFIFWELWKFIAPGLYKKEKRMALVVTVATAICFLGGALFGYRCCRTPALTYMLSFAEIFPGNLHFKIEPAVMMDEVVGFMLAMLLGTGVAFELPVVLAVMGWLGLIKAKAPLALQQVRAGPVGGRRRRADARARRAVAGADGRAAVRPLQRVDPDRLDHRARAPQEAGGDGQGDRRRSRPVGLSQSGKNLTGGGVEDGKVLHAGRIFQ